MSLKRTIQRRMHRDNGWPWPRFIIYERLKQLRKQGVRWRWVGPDQWVRK